MAVSDTVCRREAGLARVEGVTRRWAWHSPAGFEGGCGDSGPAEPALDILLEATGERDFAAKHHQAFKREFVAPLPTEGGVIEAATIREWIEKRQRDRGATRTRAG